MFRKYYDVIVLGIPIETANQEYSRRQSHHLHSQQQHTVPTSSRTHNQQQQQHLPQHPRVMSKFSDRQLISTRRLITYLIFLVHGCVLAILLGNSPSGRYQRFQDEVFWLDTALGNLGGCSLLAGDQYTISMPIVGSTTSISSSQNQNVGSDEIGMFDVMDCALRTPTGRNSHDDPFSYRQLRIAMRRWSLLEVLISSSSSTTTPHFASDTTTSSNVGVTTTSTFSSSHHHNQPLTTTTEMGSVLESIFGIRSIPPPGDIDGEDDDVMEYKGGGAMLPIPSYAVRVFTSVAGGITMLPESISRQLGVSRARRLFSHHRQALLEVLRLRYEFGGDLAEGQDECPYIPGEGLMPVSVMRALKREKAEELEMEGCSYHPNFINHQHNHTALSSSCENEDTISDRIMMDSGRQVIASLTQRQRALKINALDALLLRSTNTPPTTTSISLTTPLVSNEHHEDATPKGLPTNTEGFSTNRLTPWLLPFHSPTTTPTTTSSSSKSSKVTIAALDISLHDDVYDPLSPFGQPRRLRSLLTAPEFHKSPQKAVRQFNEILNEIQDAVMTSVRSLLNSDTMVRSQPSDELIVDLNISPGTFKGLRQHEDFDDMLRKVNDGMMKSEFGPRPPLDTSTSSSDDPHLTPTSPSPSSSVDAAVVDQLQTIPIEPMVCYIAYRTLMSVSISTFSKNEDENEDYDEIEQDNDEEGKPFCSRYFGSVSFIPGTSSMRPAPTNIHYHYSATVNPSGLTFRARCQENYENMFSTEIRARLDTLMMKAGGNVVASDDGGGVVSSGSSSSFSSSLFIQDSTTPLIVGTSEALTACQTQSGLHHKKSTKTSSSRGDDFTILDWLKFEAKTAGKKTTSGAFVQLLKGGGHSIAKKPINQNRRELSIWDLATTDKSSGLTSSSNGDQNGITINIQHHLDHTLREIASSLDTYSGSNNHYSHRKLLFGGGGGTSSSSSLAGDVLVLPVAVLEESSNLLASSSSNQHPLSRIDMGLARLQMPVSAEVVSAIGITEQRSFTDIVVPPPTTTTTSLASSSSVEELARSGRQERRVAFADMPAVNERSHPVIDTFPSSKFKSLKFVAAISKKNGVSSHHEIHGLIRTIQENGEVSVYSADVHPYGIWVINDLGFTLQQEFIPQTLRPALSISHLEIFTDALRDRKVSSFLDSPTDDESTRQTTSTTKTVSLTNSVEIEGITQYGALRGVFNRALQQGQASSLPISVVEQTIPSPSTNMKSKEATTPSLAPTSILRGLLGGSHPHDTRSLPLLVIGSDCGSIESSRNHLGGGLLSFSRAADVQVPVASSANMYSNNRVFVVCTPSSASEGMGSGGGAWGMTLDVNLRTREVTQSSLESSSSDRLQNVGG